MRTNVLVVLALLASSGCRHAASGPMNLPMRWAASNEEMRIFSGAKAELLRKHAVAVVPFTDRREGRGAVGANIENGRHLDVNTDDDVGRFLSEQFAEVLRANAMNVAAVSGADRVIHGEVQRFFVTESNLYEGSVVLGITVSDARGAALWHGTCEGRSKRFGRSFSAENYQEALSSATVEAVKDLGDQPGFLDAFK